MVSEDLIKKIREDFKFTEMNPEILGVLLYGSQVTGNTTHRSDVDICIVAQNQDLHEVYKFVTHNIRALENYKIRFFEELPLYIQGEIMDNGATRC